LIGDHDDVPAGATDARERVNRSGQHLEFLPALYVVAPPAVDNAIPIEEDDRPSADHRGRG